MEQVTVVSLKERIKSVALERFMQYGVRNTTIDDIGQEVRISKKTFYQHFPDKATLVYEVVKDFIDERKKEFEEKILHCADPVESLYQYFEMVKRILHSVHPSVPYELQRFYPQAWQLVHTFSIEFIGNAFTDLLERGKRKGVFRKKIDAEIIAKIHVYSVRGILLQFPIEHIPLDAGFEQYMVLFIRGICTAKGLKRFEALKVA